MFELSYQPLPASRKMEVKPKNDPLSTPDMDLDKAVDELLLKRYTPACVVINQDLDIIQFRGATGLFLDPSPGKASLNLLKMARPDLSFEIRNLVQKSMRSGEATEKSWVEAAANNRQKKISIESIPMKLLTGVADKYFLIVFQESTSTTKDPNIVSVSKDNRVKQLESELNALRDDMRNLLESQETANEELQSVNEEILSSNEELQSINEELETSKEELESSNEELITVNQELQMRNEQLVEILEYSEAVFTTIREGLLILDKNLRIKNANTCFYRMFSLSENEIEGKLVYEIDNKQWDIPILRELLEDIIPKNSQVQDFEVVHPFGKAEEKVLLLNARRLVRKLHVERLILLAFEDITVFKRSEKMLRREQWFRDTAENSPIMIWVAGLDKKNEFVNKTWLDYRDTTFGEAIGKSWIEDEVHPDDRKNIKIIFDESFRKQKPFTIEYRLEKNGEYKRMLTKGNPRYDNDGRFSGYIGSCIEIPFKME